MTESTYRMRLLRVHPLDAPVVALAVRPSAANAVRGVAAVEAVKFHGGRTLDAFFADDGEGVGRLAAFVGESPIVVHGLAAMVDAPGVGGAAWGGVAWDMREFGELLMPASADDALAPLAVRLGLDAGEAPGAETVRLVYGALVERARGLPTGVLRRLSDLLRRAQSPLAELAMALADSPAGAEAGPIGGVDQREIANRLERPRALAPPRTAQLVEPDEVAALLAQDGPFARRFPRYEARPEQAAMSRAVAEAFGARGDRGDPHHLVVEGGTGIGKSIAYLLPAVLFAARNNARVVVSTNTINLQEQLVTKDIPSLLAVLDGVPGLDLPEFRYAQLKGKANYLCLRRWEAMANAEAGAPDDARTMAKTLLWLRETTSGDRAELHLEPAELASWERLSASGFAVCSGAREGACFYRHARDEAAAAHLLVVNHSLLLSDMQVEGSLLPEYDYLIVDEAHNLEAEATRQFGFRVAQSTVEELAERLGNIIHGAGNVVRIGGLEPERREVVQRRLEEAQAPAPGVREAWAHLTAKIAAFAAGARGAASDEGEVRITAAQRAQPAWSEIDIAWAEFERGAAELSGRAEALVREMEELPIEIAPGLEQLRGDAAEWLLDQAAARERVREFASQPDPETVYWTGRGSAPSLNGAPLDVGPRLRDALFACKRAVVLTSATLAVAGEFGHVRSRLGIDEPHEVCLGSPFDYERAALLCLPTDVPEPNSDGYADAVARVVRRLAEAAGGRTLALFTSHAGVRGAAARLRRALPERGIKVLAQGVDGTPQQLLARFRRHPEAVLLGDRIVLGGGGRGERGAEGAGAHEAAVQRADRADLSPRAPASTSGRSPSMRCRRPCSASARGSAA